jgi:hypothetical protein
MEPLRHVVKNERLALPRSFQNIARDGIVLAFKDLGEFPAVHR